MLLLLLAMYWPLSCSLHLFLQQLHFVYATAGQGVHVSTKNHSYYTEHVFLISHHHHSSSSKALQDTDFLHYRLSAATTTTSTTAPPPPYSPDDTTYTPLQSKGYRPSAPRYISRRKTKLTVVSVLCNESRDSISTKRSWSMLSLLLLISLFMVFRSDAGY